MNDMSTKIVAETTGRGARFTTAEFERMCKLGTFDDMTVELVDGGLERLNKPMDMHASRQAMIVGMLWAALGVERQGLIRAEIGIDMGGDTVLACDAALLRAPLSENRWPRPDELLLVIEVSETTLGRDLGMKVPRYAAAGISNCWVVDGTASVIHSYGGLVNGTYGDVAVVRFGEPLSIPGTDATITLT